MRTRFILVSVAVLAAVLPSLFLNILSAQELAQGKSTLKDRFYADIKFSYGFPFLGNSIPISYAITETEEVRISPEERTSVVRKSGWDKNYRLSYGQGPSAIMQFGYRIIPYISVEMGLGYLYGFSNYTLKDKVDNRYVSYERGKTEDLRRNYTQRSSSSSLFSGSVSAVFSPHFKRWNPYLKIGLLVYAGSMVLSQDIGEHKEYFSRYEDRNPEELILSQGFIEEIKYTGVSGVGVTSSLGLLCHISKLISVFAEFNVNAIHCTATRSEVIRSEVYEHHNLYGSLIDENHEQLTTWQRYTRYVDKMEWTDASNPISEDEPSVALKEKFPFSSIGLSVGVRFKF